MLCLYKNQYSYKNLYGIEIDLDSLTTKTLGQCGGNTVTGSSLEGEVIFQISSYKRWSYCDRTGRQTEFGSFETWDSSPVFPVFRVSCLPPRWITLRPSWKRKSLSSGFSQGQLLVDNRSVFGIPLNFPWTRTISDLINRTSYRAWQELQICAFL